MKVSSETEWMGWLMRCWGRLSEVGFRRLYAAAVLRLFSFPLSLLRTDHLKWWKYSRLRYKQTRIEIRVFEGVERWAAVGGECDFWALALRVSSEVSVTDAPVKHTVCYCPDDHSELCTVQFDSHPLRTPQHVHRRSWGSNHRPSVEWTTPPLSPEPQPCL